jgi:hypothetical protein
MESGIRAVVRSLRAGLVRCAFVAVAMLGVGSSFGVASAQAEPVWVEGFPEYTKIFSCVQRLEESGTGAYLAYLEPDGTPPLTGEVYYVAAVVAGLGGTCDGTIYNPQVRLPAGTELAVSAENPVYCFAGKEFPLPRVDDMCAGVETLPNGNVQIDSEPEWAGEFNGLEVAPNFPIGQGYWEEEHIPVVSTQPLNGAQKVESDIWTTDEGGQHLHPWVAPVVEPAPLPPGGEGGTGGGGSGGGTAGGTPGTGTTTSVTTSTSTAGSGSGAMQTAGSTTKPRLRKCRKGFRRKVVKIRRHGKLVRGKDGKPKTKVLCVKKRRRHRSRS